MDEHTRLNDFPMDDHEKFGDFSAGVMSDSEEREYLKQIKEERDKDKQIVQLAKERDELDKALDVELQERDCLSDQILDIYVALGGTLEWTGCLDLGKEAKELAETLVYELNQARDEIKRRD